MTESSCTTLANCFNTQSTDEDPWIGVETFGYIVKFELSIFDSANVAQELSIMLTPSHTESLQTLSCTACVAIRGACVCVCAEVLVLGVGGRVQRVPENVKAYLRSKAIALEVSDTVRTYKCLSLNVV